jgi:putative ABC transport system permease protein
MDLGSDVRVAFRQLRSAPGYALAALAILGLGIGAGTAIFTVVRTVLLKPLPYDEPDRLVSICETNPAVDRYCIASPPNVMDWADATTRFEDMGFARQWTFLMRQDGRAAGVAGGYATPGWFRALRVVPEVGRLFEAADLEDGARVALLEHGLWLERFGGDPGVTGRTVILDGEPYTVTGVLPATFVPADLGVVRIWTLPPWDPRDEERRSWRGFVVAARLADGALIEQARAELESVRAALEPEHPETNQDWGVRVLPLHEQITGSLRPVFLMLSGAVGLLLLVACANLANLALVRATGRRREMAVRAAIGAGRKDLIRPLLTESLLIGAGGGVAGFGLALLATRMIVRLAPGGIPRIEETTVDLSTLLFAFGLAVLTAIVFGLAPAVWASKVNLVGILREGPGAGRSPRGTRIRRLLVAAEVALTLMLLVGAGLLVRSFSSLLQWEPGFDRNGVLAFSAFAPVERYTDAAQVGMLWQRLEEEIAALPGVTSVATVSAGPVFGGIETDRFEVVGQAPLTEPPALRWYDAAPSWFTTLGVPIVRGRAFSEQDRRGDPEVAVINETLAARFGGRDPIGERIRLLETGGEFEIVGVVADVAPFEAGRPVEPELWWSNRQHPRWGTFFVIRSALDPAALSRSIRERFDAVDPEIQTRTANTLEALVGRRLVGPRFNLFLVAVLGAIAFVLASAGVYGVVAYMVATRRREIGIRMALGEGRSGVIARVLREGSATAALGLVVGIGGALALSRFLQTLLYGVTPRDPATYAATAVLLLGASTAACLAPALRASRTDPASVLREE